jgi:endonuclease YncB( thermonuclease family)
LYASSKKSCCAGLLLIKRFISTLIAVVLLAGASWQAAACDQLRDGPQGRVASVTDGDTVVLESGLAVRLIGIQAPKLSLGRAGFKDWPLADKAQRVLSQLVLGQAVQLRYADAEKDRHGRALAHLFLSEGTQKWVQKAMLGAGLARVYSFSDNRFCLDPLFKAEASARVEKRGIWSDPYYQLRYAERPEEVLRRVDHYELVEGRVLDAQRAGARIYLNFGRYWKEDFTVVIDRAGQKEFKDADIDPLGYKGMMIRVRGWIDERDGPGIAVTHPEQIEILATP